MEMNKYASCFLLLFSISSLATAVQNFGFEWKPYDGEIPSDAFVAGSDNYKPVYIGQASVQGGVIPGRLDEDDYHVYYLREEQVESANKDLKILCSYQRAFPNQWLPTSTEELSRSSKMFLISGGHEQDMNIYIGRVMNGEETTVGKIMCNNFYCSPLYAIRDGVQVQHYTFEVLRSTPALGFPRIG